MKRNKARRSILTRRMSNVTIVKILDNMLMNGMEKERSLKTLKKRQLWRKKTPVLILNHWC